MCFGLASRSMTLDDLNCYRVSTNLTEQISRRFPVDSRRDFKKIQDMFALLRPAMQQQCTESTSLPKYRTNTLHAQNGGRGKDNKKYFRL